MTTMRRTACQRHPGMCAGDPNCSDRLCPGHPAQARIQQRRVQLQDLDVPESAVRAARQFAPDFGIEGPFYPRRSRRTWRRVVGWVLDLFICAALVGCIAFTFGAAGRHAGLF